MNTLIITGYNCEAYLQKCAESVRDLQGEWKAIFISDGSTDKTSQLLFNIEDSRIITEHYTENKGAAYRRYQAIHTHCKPDDVVLLVGMDDSILPYALHYITDHYEAGKLMTYGNWRNDHSVFPRELLYYDDTIHADRSYRQHKYRSTHICTFKAELFFKLSEEDFKVNGEWIKATTESPIMFAALEMCGKERIGVIETPIYFYNDRNKQKAKFRFGRQYQEAIYKEIVSRPKFDLI